MCARHLCLAHFFSFFDDFMHVRKAQSATEYLMTYGWALLAIMIVGVLLYSYVFNERNCTYGASGFPMIASVLPDGNEYSVNADGSIAMLLASRLEKDANITKINGEKNL